MTVVSALVLLAVVVATLAVLLVVARIARSVGDREVTVSVRLLCWRIRITVK